MYATNEIFQLGMYYMVYFQYREIEDRAKWERFYFNVRLGLDLFSTEQ